MEPVTRRLLLFGAIAFLLYTLFAIHYPLEPSLNDARASWTSLNKGQIGWLIVQLVLYAALFWLYAAAMRLLKGETEEALNLKSRRRGLNTWIIATWLACSLVLMAAAPAGESHDVFDYVFRGRMMAEFHANPLSDLPNQYSRKAYYLYIAWHGYVDTYGPLWETASQGAAAGVRPLAEALGWWGKDLPSCPYSTTSCRLLILYLSSLSIYGDPPDRPIGRVDLCIGAACAPSLGAAGAGRLAVEPAYADFDRPGRPQ